MVYGQNVPTCDRLRECASLDINVRIETFDMFEDKRNQEN